MYKMISTKVIYYISYISPMCLQIIIIQQISFDLWKCKFTPAWFSVWFLFRFEVKICVLIISTADQLKCLGHTNPNFCQILMFSCSYLKCQCISAMMYGIFKYRLIHDLFHIGTRHRLGLIWIRNDSQNDSRAMSLHFVTVHGK